MKPSFALTLSFEGIGLLQRAFPGWKTVGEVSLDTVDLRGSLDALRAQAAMLDSAELISKLVLPNDQIKYLSFQIDQGDTDNVAQLVRDALAGTTPYAIEDLAIDWSIDGKQVFVAAVARETLTEAESFAAEYQFEPLCFVAIPEPGYFAGEPHFGTTRFARAKYGDDVSVERDAAPVRIVGVASLPDASSTEPEESAGTDITPEDTVEAGPAAVPAPDEAEDVSSVETLVAGSEEPVELPDAETVADVVHDDEPKLDEIQPDPAPSTEATFTSIRAQRLETVDQPAPRLSGAMRGDDTMIAASIPIEPEDTLASEYANPSHTPLPDQDAATDEPSSVKNTVSTFLSRRAQPRETPAAAEPPRRASPAPQVTQDAANEAQRLTVFGARKADAVGGKPKHLGFILTLVLLAFLAGVAAWASIFMEDGVAGLFGPRTEDSITAQLPDDAEDELSIEGEEAMLPDAEATVALNADAEQSLIESTDNAVFEALNENELTMDPDEAQALYAVSGVWQMAPDVPQTPEQITLDDLYVASIDSAITQSDAVALPTYAEANTDRDPTRNSSPAAAGTQFSLDSRGFVVATAQGAQTPDGVTVFAGRPAVVPTAFPTRENEVVQAEVTETLALSKLAEFRPKPRPENLIEQNERSTLGGLSRQELAAFRPKLRPAIIQQDPEDVEAGTAQAVGESRKPNARPTNFSKIIARAQKTPKPKLNQEVTQVVAVAPRTVAPKIPSSASVAKQATVRNAINLKKVNLIGVYGKSNSRRALVRLSNGRYKKVQVGDRIDGGRVAAIGEGELRYTKNGRNVVLKMPKG